MAWQMVGSYYAPCSCNVGCPCTLGETEADRGWCSGALAFDIREGNVDGEDIGGTKIVLAGDWPSSFVSGNGTARLLFDPAVSDSQRSALEALLQGKKGGLWEGVAGLVSKWLPSEQAAIRIRKDGETTRIEVEGHGELISTPLKGANGEPTRLVNAAAAFREDIVLGKGSGSNWKDSEMRAWEGGGHAEQSEFDWRA